MRFYIKDRGGNHAEAWIEDWERVYCSAKLIVSGKDQCLVDEIETKVEYRRQGMAARLLENLESIFAKVSPIGIVDNSKEFWEKLGYEDALGVEDEK